MNVSQELTSILNQIQRNQQQIDLLSSNNNHLVSFLIQTGMVENLKTIPGFQFDAPRGVQLALPEPPVSPKRQEWTKERRQKLSKTMKAKYTQKHAQKTSKSKWTTAQRAHFSKLMKDRWKQGGDLRKSNTKAATAKA